MPVPVLSVEQMRQWEQATWATGQTVAAVIERVGRALAACLLQLTQPGDSILILVGRGHNGNDARAAIPHLRTRKLIVVQAKDPRAAKLEFEKKIKSVAKRERLWIIDALFGIGLNRPLDAAWQSLIDAVNQSGARVLSVDVPSGLNADNGQVEGAAIRADLTLTIGTPKRGLLGTSEWVGRLEVVHDAGLISCPLKSELNWTLPDDFADWPPRRPVESNKGTFGHLDIIAGSLGYHGAAVLATHGAMRAQPGLITVEPQKSVYVPVAAQLQAAMVRPWQAANSLPKGCSAILFGPGLAQANLPAALTKKLRSLWKSFPGAMLVDASALDWLKPGEINTDAVRVITPHPGEAGRLLGKSAKEIQADRLGSLREISRRFGNCHVVLKGNQTLVGRATGPVFVNSSGNPHLAQGGSGDLLSGFLAGLLAQPPCARDALTTVRFAAWAHGAAADFLARTQPNWTVEDLSTVLGSVRAED
jgi:ADP-dependent NAD(P)H-hydrate dehydratase / NAD(P)H-hydrate epimerase